MYENNIFNYILTKLSYDYNTVSLGGLILN